jgi:hypothetical protein
MTTNEQIELMNDRAHDIAAVLITRPAQRVELLEHLCNAGADSETVALITQKVLEWTDELLLPREADSIRRDLETRAEVAVSVTPEGLAGLTESDGMS